MKVYKGRHLHRDVAVKELQLEAGLKRAVQREVSWPARCIGRRKAQAPWTS